MGPARCRYCSRILDQQRSFSQSVHEGLQGRTRVPASSYNPCFHVACDYPCPRGHEKGCNLQFKLSQTHGGKCHQDPPLGDYINNIVIKITVRPRVDSG